MINKYTKIAMLGLALASGAANAQTISTFENVTLSPNTYWNGSDSTNIGGFTSGNAFYANAFNFSWDYWSTGFAVSNKMDTSTADTTSGYSMMYNAIVPKGAQQSANYAIVQNGSMIKLTGAAAGKQADGVYITNSNYAYLSMKWGDVFAKQFTDTDYFELDIVGYKNGEETDTTITFYLADGTDLVDTWEWVDLKPLGDVDSIGFYLESSDTAGGFGMNTPGFFCLDNFTTRDIRTGINQIAAQLKGVSVYPNPATDMLTIETATQQATARIYSITGKQIITQALVAGKNAITIETLETGMYILQLESNGIVETRKLVVE